MLNLNIPALIKIREGITVNPSLAVSQAVEHDVPQWKLKDEVKKESDEGKLNRAFRQDDYEQTGTCNTASFWFIDGKSLVYRVGQEITEEDFTRISADLANLTYVRKPKK